MADVLADSNAASSSVCVIVFVPIASPLRSEVVFNCLTVI